MYLNKSMFRKERKRVHSLHYFSDSEIRITEFFKGKTIISIWKDSFPDIFRKHFKDNGKDFLQLLKYARENHHSYDDIVAAAEEVVSRGAKRLSSDLLKVALETSRAGEHSFREDQKTDEFLEIEIGSEDILSQLDRAMENGTTLENNDQNKQEKVRNNE